VVLTDAGTSSSKATRPGAGCPAGQTLFLQYGKNLRVKDIDFAQHQLVLRDTKGNESRVTMLPNRVVEPLQSHLQTVRRLHHQDLDRGYGSVYLPYALERKYPHADRQWIWQYVFPADRLSQDPRSGITRHTHVLNRGGRGDRSPLDA